MSRSNYTDTTTSGVTRDRDYDRDRTDRDARHHGKWTASGEARDFADTNRGTGILGRSASDRYDNDRFDRNRDRDFDRDYDRDYDRNDRYRDRGLSGYNSGYSSSYGSGLNSGFGSSFPQHYGSSGFGSSYPSTFGSGFGGVHPASSFGAVHPGSYYGYGSSSYDSAFPHQSYGQHYGSGLNSGFASPLHYSSGYGSSYPQHYGSGMNSGFGSPLHYGMGGLGGMGQQGFGQSYGSRSLGQGLGGMGQQGYGRGRPEVDVYEVGTDYIIEMDLPGHSRDHVETKLLGNELHILSKPPKRDHQFHLNERSLGRHDVSRKLYLPPNANSQKINAALTNGVLRITIPKTIEQQMAAQSGAATVLPGSTGATLVQPVTKVVTDTTTTTTETKRV